MDKDILIFGKGFIGEQLQEAFDCQVSTKILNSFDNADEEVKKYNPKIIINCIGYTGDRNVDGCEVDKSQTLFANTFVPIILGEVAVRNNIKLVHISSGCIYHFDYENQKPVVETDTPDFFNLFYSRSKIYAEQALKSLFSVANILIVRIRIPLDCKPHPKNILTKLLRFNKVIDIPNSITYIPDFIGMLEHLIGIDAKGIYNTVNKSGLRYPELLDIYKKYTKEHSYELINYNDLGLARTNLVMSVDKLESTGFKVRDIHDVLNECVKEYIQN